MIFTEELCFYAKISNNISLVRNCSSSKNIVFKKVKVYFSNVQSRRNFSGRAWKITGDCMTRGFRSILNKQFVLRILFLCG